MVSAFGQTCSQFSPVEGNLDREMGVGEVVAFGLRIELSLNSMFSSEQSSDKSLVLGGLAASHHIRDSLLCFVDCDLPSCLPIRPL